MRGADIQAIGDVLRVAERYCVVLRGAAWCCVVLRGAAWCCEMLHDNTLRVGHCCV